MINGLSNIGAIGATRGFGDLNSDGTGQIGPSQTMTPGQAAGLGESFSETMANMASDMANDLRRAEVMSIAGIKGEANTRDVVDAVMSAEQSLQTALSIRDKLVTAYMEISRMQI